MVPINGKGEHQHHRALINVIVGAAIREIEGLPVSQPTSTETADFWNQNSSRGVKIIFRKTAGRCGYRDLVRYGYGVTGVAKRSEQGAANVESMTGLKDTVMCT
jgi:uncharacterized alkaline shock family protein YloU